MSKKKPQTQTLVSAWHSDTIHSHPRPYFPPHYVTGTMIPAMSLDVHVVLVSSLSPSVRLYLPLTCIDLLLWRGGHVTPYDTSSSLTSSLIHDLHICFDLFIILLSWVSKTVIFCVGLVYFLSARPGRGKSLLCCSSWISTIYYSPVLPDFTWCFFVIQIQGLKIKSVLTD